MYLHLGQEIVVREEEVVGIFDLDTSTVSKHTRKFLEKTEKEKKVINVSYELPKSFIVCSKGKKQKRVYISQISSGTLKLRSNLERNEF